METIFLLLVVLSLQVSQTEQCEGMQVEFYLNKWLWETCKSMDAWYIGETALGRKCRSIICDDGSPMKQLYCAHETRLSPNSHRFALALDAFGLRYGNRTRHAIGKPITDKSIDETFCCALISTYINMRLTSERVCDCNENCMPIGWMSAVSTVWISYTHDIAFFSDERCSAEKLRFSGIDQGTPCASNNYFDGIRADCTKIMNDDAGSLRIITRNHSNSLNITTPVVEDSLHNSHSFFTGRMALGLFILAICCLIACFVYSIKLLNSRNVGKSIGMINV